MHTFYVEATYLHNIINSKSICLYRSVDTKMSAQIDNYLYVSAAAVYDSRALWRQQQ